MATISQSPELATIDNNTVDQAVGLCYFDLETETLIEIDKLPDMFLSVEPEGAAIRKFYMVMSPVDIVTWVQLFIISNDYNATTYSIKVIISEEEPPISAFSILPSYNSYRIDNPPMGEFLSVWLLIENISKVNEIVNIGLTLNYE
ncbi:MAG: hypothetical protein DRQ78_04110 [Epsilonproteobacteria bacterium]|nr:MAG: hypothetical protein DRQ78_04110 [Campylobacterota bacterium]